MRLFLDNPVLRHILRTRRRALAGWHPALVPLAGIVALLVASEAWRRAGFPFHLCLWRSAHRLGYAAGPIDGALILTSVMYWIHCVVMPFWALSDPLSQSIRDHAGGQLVASGLSPATWLVGHILAVAYELCITLVAYTPVFMLCIFFGAATPAAVGLLVAVGPLIGITARLLWLLSLRCPGSGTAACFLALLGFVLPAVASSVSWTPLAALSPFPLLRAVIPGAVLFCSSHAASAAWLTAATERLAGWPMGITWATLMIRTHLVCWCLLLPGVLAGEVRMHLHWSAPGLGSARVLGSVKRLGAPARATRLEWAQVMRLFSANGSSYCRALWEVLHLFSITVAVGVLAAIWVLHLEEVLQGQARVIAVGASVLALVAGIGLGLCVDRGVFSQQRLAVYLLPHVSATAIRIAALVFGVHYAETVMSGALRINGSVLPALLMLLFSVTVLATWQSLKCRSRGKAQIGLMLGLAVWLGLTALIIRQGWLPLTGASGVVCALTLAVAAAGLAAGRRSAHGGGG